jgi:anti-anti-sigma regulatory factor
MNPIRVRPAGPECRYPGSQPRGTAAHRRYPRRLRLDLLIVLVMRDRIGRGCSGARCREPPQNGWVLAAPRISQGLANRFTAEVNRFAEGHVTNGDDPQKPWNIRIEWERSSANTTVVHVCGDLRGDAAASLRRTLAGQLTGTPELLVINLSNTVEIDSEGIDALHSVAELADEDDIRFCLVVPPEGAVRTCPKLVELTGTFQTFSSITEALQHPHDRAPCPGGSHEICS